MIIGENTTDSILDLAGKYDSVVFVAGNTAVEKYGMHIPDLESIRGELTKIILNEGDNLKNVRNYQKIVKVLIDRNISQDSLLVALGCGEVIDLAGFVVSTYMGGMDYIPIPTTLLAQVSNSVSGLAGINFSSHEDVICSRVTPREIIADSFYSKSLSNEDIRDGLTEMIRDGIIADHSIISMMQSLDDLRSFRESDAMCRLIGKSIKIRTEFSSRQNKSGERAMGFGRTFGSVLGEIFRDRVAYSQYMSTAMFLEFFLAERSGVSVREQREKMTIVLEKFGIKRANIKDAGLENILKKLGERFPGENASIKLRIPVEPGKGETIEIGKDRLFSLLRSYSELYEFTPA